MLTLWLRRDTFLWILVFGLESHLMSLTSLVLEQVLDFWSFMTMYKPVDIKMCRWCGRCWAETLSWQVTIPNANKDPSGEFLNFLATIVNPHHSLQIMHEIKQSDTTKIVTINNVLLLPRKKKKKHDIWHHIFTVKLLQDLHWHMVHKLLQVSKPQSYKVKLCIYFYLYCV